MTPRPGYFPSFFFPLFLAECDCDYKATGILLEKKAT